MNIPQSVQEIQQLISSECSKDDFNFEAINELIIAINKLGAKADLVFRDRNYGKSLSLEKLSGIRRIFFRKCTFTEVKIGVQADLEEIIVRGAFLKSLAIEEAGTLKLEIKDSADVRDVSINKISRLSCEIDLSANVVKMNVSNTLVANGFFLSQRLSEIIFQQSEFPSTLSGEFANWISVNSLNKVEFRDCGFLEPVNLINISGPVFTDIRFNGCKFKVFALRKVRLECISLAKSRFSESLFLQLSGVAELNIENVISSDIQVTGDGRNVIASHLKVGAFSVNSPNFANLDISRSEIETAFNIQGGSIDRIVADLVKVLGRISFKELEVSHLLKFEDSIIENFAALNLKVLGRASFNRSTFNKAPDFRSASLSQDTDFIDSGFLDLKSDSAEAYYRDLKQKMDEKHNEQARTQFASLELGCRKFKLPLFNFERICSEFYWAFNGYGQKSFRPVLWLVLLCFLMMPVYSTGGRVVPNVNYADKNYKETWLGQLNQVHVVNFSCIPFLNSDSAQVEFAWVGVVYSFLNSLGPLRLLAIGDSMLPKNSLIQLLGLVQSILSSILLYLLVSNIKRKLSITG